MSDSKKPTSEESAQKFKVLEFKPKEAPKEEAKPEIDEYDETVSFLTKLLETIKGDRTTKGVVVFAYIKQEGVDGGSAVIPMGGGYLPVAETVLALREFELANLIRRI